MYVVVTLQVLLGWCCSFVYMIQFCPSGPVWQRRAIDICTDKHLYHCLLDTNANAQSVGSYVERCISPKGFKGKRYVFSGNINALDCNKTRYAPQPVLSNSTRNSECPLRKSLCNEEGQVTIDNGTTETDISCRCNYTEGYNYVNRPTNPCKCFPMVDDCSCYIHRCSDPTKVLSQDYECERRELAKFFKCDVISGHTSGTKLKEEVKIEDGSFDVDISSKTIIPLIMITSLISICFVVFITIGWDGQGVTQRWKRHYKKEIQIKTEMYIQNMQVVSHYQTTRQLHEIENLFENQRKQIVILEGLFGSGKTQTAHKFCMSMKAKFCVIAKIMLSKSLSLKEALVNFAEDMNYRISYEEAVNFKIVVDNIKNCFNQTGRYHAPKLIFIDGIDEDTVDDYNEITHFVALVDDVPDLKIILASTNQSLVRYFKKHNYGLVQFGGMKEKEYFQIFKDLDVTAEDINRLVQVTGNLPLAVISAMRSMITFDWTASQYIDEFKSNTQLVPTHSDDHIALKTQIIILSHLKKTLSESEWEVVSLIPLLQFTAISTTVLDACLFHVTRYQSDVRKGKSGSVWKALINLALCEVESVKPARMKKSSIHKFSKESNLVTDNTNTVMSFHKVTIEAFNLLAANYIAENREKQLTFLLKMFCFEIDLDAATDITVERNERFVHHAINLLSKVETAGNNTKQVNNKEYPLKTNCTELQFYIAYLNCAIGSTFLFERTKVKKAHQYLMKSRQIVADIVKSKCDFKKANCIYLQALNNVQSVDPIDILHTNSVMKTVVDTELSTKIAKEFILGKHRSLSDINVIKNEINERLTVFESHYLTEDDYSVLLEKKLALPFKKLAELLLSELLLRILHNNGIALNDLKYVIRNIKSLKENKMLLKTCHRELDTTIALRNEIEKHFSGHLQMFVCVRNKRNGRMLMLSNDESVDGATLDEYIKEFEHMIQCETGIVYDIGIVKYTDKSNTRHKSLCRRNILNILVRKFTEARSDDIRQKLLLRCSMTMKQLSEDIHQLETDSMNYSWLMLPLLYIECGQMLLLHENTSSLENALEWFEKAIIAEQSRGAIWTQFIFRAYLGKIQCLQNLHRFLEAYNLINNAISLLTGQNRDEIIELFRTYRLRVKFHVPIELQQ